MDTEELPSSRSHSRPPSKRVAGWRLWRPCFWQVKTANLIVFRTGELALVSFAKHGSQVFAGSPGGESPAGVDSGLPRSLLHFERSSASCLGSGRPPPPPRDCHTCSFNLGFSPPQASDDQDQPRPAPSPCLFLSGFLFIFI